MNPICTLYLDGITIGTITEINGVYVLTDKESRKNVYLHEKGYADYPLRYIAHSEPYIIIRGSTIISGEKEYTYEGGIPYNIRYTVLPYVPSDSIIKYDVQNDVDWYFLYAGYAKELKEAVKVYIPSNMNEYVKDGYLEFLLIGRDNRSFNGASINVSDGILSEIGRYKYVTDIEMGRKKHDLGVTYTPESLVVRVEALNDRYHEYEKERSHIASETLKYLSESIDGNMEGSELYNDVSRLTREYSEKK